MLLKGGDQLAMLQIEAETELAVEGADALVDLSSASLFLTGLKLNSDLEFLELCVDALYEETAYLLHLGRNEGHLCGEDIELLEKEGEGWGVGGERRLRGVGFDCLGNCAGDGGSLCVEFLQLGGEVFPPISQIFIFLLSIFSCLNKLIYPLNAP